MEVQSLSICVPTKGCINKCKFCVSRLHANPYPEHIDWVAIRQRMQFTINNGCNTVILTGTGEPIQNKEYLSDWAGVNRELTVPFAWIELQSSGVRLNKDNLKFLKHEIGVKTISLSLSDMFNDENNQEMCGTSDEDKVNIPELCKAIKGLGFNLRLSLNMTKKPYRKITFQDIASRCHDLDADQVTFRKLYCTPGVQTNGIHAWIQENKLSDGKYEEFASYCAAHGKAIAILPFGAISYAYEDISFVFDNDCMDEELKETMKYLILRPNSKLYSKWETKASLIF